MPAWRSLIFSDIPNDRLLRWDEVSGQTSVFRQPSGFVNGNTIDGQGRLISCSQGERQVSAPSTTGAAPYWPRTSTGGG